jgi:hypothetical protein
MGTVPTPADNGNETPRYIERVQLVRSILNHRAEADGFTEAAAERACYEARMALDGRSLREIGDWHALAGDLTSSQVL